MIKTATRLLLVFLASCTVTKRVHRPGYHIEWKKHYKTQKSSKEYKELDGVSKTLEMDALKVQEAAFLTERSYELEPLLDISSTEKEQVLLDVVEEELKEHNSKEQREIRRTRKYAPFESLKERTQKKSKQRLRGIPELRNIGYVLLGIAGFLLIGVFFAYFGLWALESLFYNLVFSGNGIVAGILGFVIFLIILLLVFLAFAIVEYLMGSYIIGLIVAGITAAVGGLCLLIANNY